MKYLKLFESTTNRQKKLSDDIKELKENREDIANVLIYYYDNFFDNITNEIAEFVYNWGRGEDVADSFDKDPDLVQQPQQQQAQPGMEGMEGMEGEDGMSGKPAPNTGMNIDTDLL